MAQKQLNSIKPAPKPRRLKVLNPLQQLSLEEAARIVGFDLSKPISELGKTLIIGRAERMLGGEKFLSDADLAREIARIRGELDDDEQQD